VARLCPPGGAIIIDRRDYERLTGDQRVNDLALWLARARTRPRCRCRAPRRLAAADAGSSAPGAVGLDTLLEFASASQIRATSLRIFDRSFAVTYWLQAVAIGIGLFGVAASFSAQVLARRKEFGLLAHLGLTRRQILAVVAGEGAAWTADGLRWPGWAWAGGSVVLVQGGQPAKLPLDHGPGRALAAPAGAVRRRGGAGTVTAWLAGRAAAGRDAVLAVKEDW
jgi:putative ABC transport system permease protein